MSWSLKFSREYKNTFPFIYCLGVLISSLVLLNMVFVSHETMSAKVSVAFEQMSSTFLSLVPGRVFIPNYISRVKVQLVDCNTKNKSGESCPVLLKIRSRAPPVHNSSAMDCRENAPCELEVPLPSWEQWYYILVERYLSSSDVYFRIGVQVKGKNWFSFWICIGLIIVS